MSSVARRATAVALGLSLAAFAAESGELKRPATNDFLLRGPSAAVEDLARQLGLEVVSRIPASQDGQGRPVHLVRAPESTSADALLAVLRRQTSLLNTEQASLASVPETGGEVRLEQRTRAILGALGTPASVAFGTDLEPYRAVWSAYVNQPAVLLLRLPEVYLSYRGAGTTIAVIDTGVDPDHPLLKDVLVGGYDFTRDLATGSEWEDLLDQRTRAILGQRTMAILGGEKAVQLAGSTSVILTSGEAAALEPSTVPPAFGHGTMVAGIIHRAAPGAKIMPLKAFRADGSAHIYDIVRAIYYAVDHGARVINMSFSTSAFSPELLRAVNYAARKGVTCVAAAGNEGQEAIVYPAALGTAIGVASTGDMDHLSAFSNHGSDLVTVAAPGENLITSYPGGGWAMVSGTSFAAPWVSGAIALFIQKNGVDHLDRANYYISVDALSRSLPVHGFGHQRSGHGRMDVKLALESLEKP